MNRESGIVTRAACSVQRAASQASQSGEGGRAPERASVSSVPSYSAGRTRELQRAEEHARLDAACGETELVQSPQKMQALRDRSTGTH